MYATVVLEGISEIAELVYQDSALAEQAMGLGREIREGIKRFGVVDHPIYGQVYAYEADGLGNFLAMDDAVFQTFICTVFPVLRNHRYHISKHEKDGS